MFSSHLKDISFTKVSNFYLKKVFDIFIAILEIGFVVCFCSTARAEIATTLFGWFSNALRTENIVLDSVGKIWRRRQDRKYSELLCWSSLKNMIDSKGTEGKQDMVGCGNDK